ncbi:MAG: hypothetical protein FD149_1644 [Rhodospirillaceae bacterium]|nr:MAG: hypothetical protein FD149_1644 [Rhodospirillaceae bacterium]
MPVPAGKGYGCDPRSPAVVSGPGVTRRQAGYLRQSDARLFHAPFTAERVARLDADIGLAEQTETFSSRFSRLQDMLGHKFLPALLTALSEPPAPFVDHLDRAERLGWIRSSEAWLHMRAIRNQMVHPYMEDPLLLSDALNAAHAFVPDLLTTAESLVREVERRFGTEERFKEQHAPHADPKITVRKD